MTSYDAAAQRYFAAWNAGPDELEKAVAAAFTEDATYTDPLADVRGHEQLTAAIAGARQQFPGFVFRPWARWTGTTRWSASAGSWSRPTARRPWPVSMWPRWRRTAGSPRSAASWTGCRPSDHAAGCERRRRAGSVRSAGW